MSNGLAGIGGFTAEQLEGSVTISVQQWWSSSDDGVDVRIHVPERDMYELGLSFDEARYLAALLLEAAGDRELAAQIPADQAARDEQARLAAEAFDTLQEIRRQAEAAFLAATSDQRATYNAAIDQAERQYTAATGRTSPWPRSVQVGHKPEESAPF